MILVDWQLLDRIRRGSIKIDPFDPSLVQPNSVDIRLGNHFVWYNAGSDVIDPFNKESVTADVDETHADYFVLHPGQFVLAETFECIPQASITLGAELKKRLGRLQGAFFNPEKGVVNYHALKHSEEFGRYLDLAGSLNSFKVELLHNDAEKKAFWINIYNVLIIHGVIEYDIQGSVFEIPNFFGRIGYTIGGLYFTPDDIEHGILRHNRSHPLFPFKPFSVADQRSRLTVASFDCRIHFALFCSSSSCPPIEFYDPVLIDRQLNTAAKSFMNRGGIEIDRKGKTLWISSLFQRYSEDFGSSTRKIILSLLPYMDEEKKAWTEENIDSLLIRYVPYNWNMSTILQ